MTLVDFPSEAVTTLSSYRLGEQEGKDTTQLSLLLHPIILFVIASIFQEFTVTAVTGVEACQLRFSIKSAVVCHRDIDGLSAFG